MISDLCDGLGIEEDALIKYAGVIFLAAGVGCWTKNAPIGCMVFGGLLIGLWMFERLAVAVENRRL